MSRSWVKWLNPLVWFVMFRVVFFLLILGPGFIVIGVAMLTSLNEPLTCYGKEMHPGDMCQETDRRGNTQTKSYDDMKSDRAKRPFGAIFFLGVGSVVTIGAVRHVIRERRNPNRNQRPDEAPVPRQQQTPPLLPPPGWYRDPAGAPRTQRYWDGTRWGPTAQF